ncbi:hypothetical protein [Roseomonas chloroacetimidivorans]|uniref:hypothetical protein n=1 Tax=Roseomonas chloroacetimidivorans TaxID=1766656 RepID=UPI003C74E9C7
MAAMPPGFPARPVRLLIAFPAGGSLDTLGRSLQQGLTEALQGAVVIENQGGANSLIATRQVVGSAADGHSLLVTDLSELAPGGARIGELGQPWVGS